MLYECFQNMTFEDYDQVPNKSEVENLRGLLFVTAEALSVAVLLIFVLVVLTWWIKR
jgi:hypothetical protein